MVWYVMMILRDRLRYPFERWTVSRGCHLPIFSVEGCHQTVVSKQNPSVVLARDAPKQYKRETEKQLCSFIVQEYSPTTSVHCTGSTRYTSRY